MYNRNHCMTGLENGNTALEFFVGFGYLPRTGNGERLTSNNIFWVYSCCRFLPNGYKLTADS